MTRKCRDFSAGPGGSDSSIMPGPVPASTSYFLSVAQTWLAGTNPAMTLNTTNALTVRLQAAIVRRRWRGAELGFQRGDAQLQRLVFLARQPRHVLDRLELLALDDVEVAQDLLGLVAHHRIDLALDALGGAGGVVHQAADLVEKPIAGLGHLEGISGRRRN